MVAVPTDGREMGQSPKKWLGVCEVRGTAFKTAFKKKIKGGLPDWLAATVRVSPTCKIFFFSLEAIRIGACGYSLWWGKSTWFTTFFF